MAILYGIPYMGSKMKIAPTLLSKMPSGERFVDLFGGGFAMTHCAMLSGKYHRFLYNDFNPLIVNLVRDAYYGKYNYKVFKPEFITREEFERKKESDGYIKYIWSFGNGGKGYLFGRDLEPLKHARHDFVVFGKPSNLLDPRAMRRTKSKDIHSRRMEFCGWYRQNNKRFDLQQLEQIERMQGVSRLDMEELERLERLQQLERVERLQQLEQLERLQGISRLENLERLERLERLEKLDKGERLEFTVGSYEYYEYQDGDIVYCDPPYEGTADYGDYFDHDKFYDWVRSRPYRVFFSSYKISREFPQVYAIKIKSSFDNGNKSEGNFEILYTNKELTWKKR